MDSTSRVKLIIIGLVLAAIVVGYFILAQRFQTNRTSPAQVKTADQSAQAAVQPTSRTVISVPSPSATAVSTSTARPGAVAQVPGSLGVSPSPAAQANQGNSGGDLASLPRTGVPGALVAVLAVSAVVSGWFLRRYPQ